MRTTPPRRHYAFTVEPVRGGWRASNVLEYPTRGMADRRMLTLCARYGDAAESVTLEGTLIEGAVLDATLLKRPSPARKTPTRVSTPPRPARSRT
jgi:hypothetical protein